MNILFYHGNGVLPFSRGVSGVILSLTSLFRDRGHKVYLLGVRNLQKGAHYDNEQHFLPNSNILSDDNLAYFSNLVKEKNIVVLINMCIGDELSLASIVQQHVNYSFKILTCYHVLFLTPQKYYAYRKEYRLRKKGLGFLFSILKLKIVRDLLVWYYIHRYRSNYLYVLGHSDKVIFLSESHKNEFLKMCGIKNTEKAVVIPNTVRVPNINSFSKNNCLVWVGNFDADCKRPDIMLYVWRRVSRLHPDWKLTMIGVGPLWEDMKVLSHELNLSNITFVGRVNSLPFYEKAKIYCCTSIHESFSLTTLEALSYGAVPILFNSFPTASEIVKDGCNGVLVTPFIIDEYSQKLSDLMGDREKLDRLFANRNVTLGNYDLESIYHLWNNLFSDVCRPS